MTSSWLGVGSGGVGSGSGSVGVFFVVGIVSSPFRAMVNRVRLSTLPSPTNDAPTTTNKMVGRCALIVSCNKMNAPRSHDARPCAITYQPGLVDVSSWCAKEQRGTEREHATILGEQHVTVAVFGR